MRILREILKEIMGSIVFIPMVCLLFALVMMSLMISPIEKGCRENEEKSEILVMENKEGAIRSINIIFKEYQKLSIMAAKQKEQIKCLEKENQVLKVENDQLKEKIRDQ